MNPSHTPPALPVTGGRTRIPPDRYLSLGIGSFRELEANGHDLHLEVLSGTAWLVIPGDPQEHILGRGRRLDLASGVTAEVRAVTDLLLAVEE